MNIWGFCVHWNQQVILSLLFYQGSHEGRIYSIPKLWMSKKDKNFQIQNNLGPLLQ